MRQKLLLTSQGIQPELKEAFLKCLTKDPSEIKVAFITTAAYWEGKKPAWLDEYRKQLTELGVKDIRDLDIKDMHEEVLKKHLSDVDVIFVNGGSTFYLLDYVRKSGFDRVLPGILEMGKIYVGVSAGSYIAAPTIEAATWKDRPESKRFGITDLTGLNLVPFLITAHFEEKYRSAIEKGASSTKYPIVALNDKQAILVENGEYRVVGAGKKEFFNGFSEKSKRRR